MSIIFSRLHGLNRSTKQILLLFTVLAFATCIDPYNPNLKGREALLVVDGLLTNENRSYSVLLSRTSAIQNGDPVKVTGAQVLITDEEDNSYGLTEVSPGLYRTDSLLFRGEPGKTYVLHIVTGEGTEYLSDPSTMYPVDPIDTVYYMKDQEISSDKNEILDGLRIFLDSENSGRGKFFRWTWDEWWKFSVPNPKRYNYVDRFTVEEVDTLKQVCWAHDGTGKILIRSAEFSQSGRIEKEPILFIASSGSDRLLMRYCVVVKQLSLSPVEYLFWEQLRETNESGGEIFDKQPFSLAGNVHCISNPEEVVLGYFQVSAVSEKRLYISPSAIKDLGLPEYQYDCERVEIGPADYPYANTTLDKIYDSYTSTGFVFIEPVYDMRLNIIKLAFTSPACALCTHRGSLRKPYFWVEE